MEAFGQLHAPVAFLQGEKPRYTLEKRLGRPQSRSENSGEEEKNPSSPIGNPTAVIYLS
jgi:hypothetical protein